MGQPKTSASNLGKARDLLREKGALLTAFQILRYGLRKAGIQITPFYYMKEVLSPGIPDFLTALPEGFEFSVFGLDEVTAINTLPEREGYVRKQYVIENFNKGETCLGIKYKGEIAAFTWFSLDQCESPFYPVKMKDNEVYLHDMYVLKSFRGSNLAPILRYRNYEFLKGMKRDTFYSITDTFNTASIRFKQKLKAQIVFLGLHVALFKKWQHRWVLRRY